MQKSPALRSRETLKQLMTTKGESRLPYAQKEAVQLPITTHSSRTLFERVWFALKLITAGLLSALITVGYVTPAIESLGVLLPITSHHDNVEAVCPQTSAIAPQLHTELLKELEDKYAKQEFHESAFEWLGGAVRVPYVLVLFPGYGGLY